MVWTLQATGADLQRAGREVCLERERRDRQDGRNRKRTGAHEDQQFPDHQTVQEGQQRGECSPFEFWDCDDVVIRVEIFEFTLLLNVFVLFCVLQGC